MALLLTARRRRYTELALLQTDREPPSGGSPSCTPRPPISWGMIRRLCGWQVHALEHLAQNAPSSVRPSWT